MRFQFRSFFVAIIITQAGLLQQVFAGEVTNGNSARRVSVGSASSASAGTDGTCFLGRNNYYYKRAPVAGVPSEFYQTYEEAMADSSCERPPINTAIIAAYANRPPINNPRELKCRHGAETFPSAGYLDTSGNNVVAAVYQIYRDQSWLPTGESVLFEQKLPYGVRDRGVCYDPNECEFIPGREGVPARVLSAFQACEAALEVATTEPRWPVLVDVRTGVVTVVK